MPTAEATALDSPFISVVVTVKNEAANLPSLLESLRAQEPPYEVILVDAYSDDETWEIAQRFSRQFPAIFRPFRRRGHRGEGRNYGALQARGEYLAFTDGDCVADTGWLAGLRRGLRTAPVVAGRTQTLGSGSFAELERVELYQHGMDVTYPSCNLAYEASLFRSLEGFDPRFITAEDIDLNLRAVRSGARLIYEPSAVIFHRTRPNLARFLLQAFWNGYGRKQLTEKHGQLWAHYRYRRMLASQRSPLASVRLAAALGGYFTRLLTGARASQRIPPEPDPEAATSRARIRA